MRELKFRVWNSDIKQMEYFASPCFSLHGRIPAGEYDSDRYTRAFEPLAEHPDWPIMQYTGLIDSNGVEIYEGDIVRLLGNDKGYLTVTFVNAYVGGWVLTTSRSEVYVSLGARKPSEVEVIGNIHENPELLSDN